MSLGRPDLYIGAAKVNPATVLPGLSLTWGSDSRLDIDPAATLSGELLADGPMPAGLNVGAAVGLVDPATSRTLFAGTLQPLTANRHPNRKKAMVVRFTAASPKTELEGHTVLDLNWPVTEYMNTRLGRIRAAMPYGWTLDGSAGWDWARAGQLRMQSVGWMKLAELHARSNLLRFADTSTYVPGAGLRKRITFTQDRLRDAAITRTLNPGPAGQWLPAHPGHASGVAVLPPSVIHRDIEWEKTPSDIITAVQLSSWGGWIQDPAAESKEHEFPLDYGTDSSALRSAYGHHPVKIETMLDLQSTAATKGAVELIAKNWLDTQSDWRPTTLNIPDSREVTTEPLVNLLAVDTRPTAAVIVPTVPAPAPGAVRAFVLGGTATRNGDKWTTDLTLGRTQ